MSSYLNGYQQIYVHSCVQTLENSRAGWIGWISSKALAHRLLCSQGFPQSSKASAKAGERLRDYSGVLRPPATGGLKTESGAKSLWLSVWFPVSFTLS